MTSLPPIDVQLASTSFMGYEGNPAHCALTICRKVLASARDGQALGSFFCIVSMNIFAVHRHCLSENAQWLCEMAETKGFVPLPPLDRPIRLRTYHAGTVMPAPGFWGVARTTPSKNASADSHRTLILTIRMVTVGGVHCWKRRRAKSQRTRQS
jgi:hypothetical protein